MNYIKIVLVGLVIVLSSCKTTEKSEANQKEVKVQEKDPLKEIAWLSDVKNKFDMVQGMAKQQIVQYTYNNQTVFLIDNCYGCSDSKRIVYDEKKNVLCEFGGFAGLNTCPDFEKSAKNRKVLYE
jgi:hypothetical protein